MPAVKSSRDDAVAAIAREFRKLGYDGASLTRLSEASGLGKSSLYHYFPRGKEDMAKAAAEHVAATVSELAIAPLLKDGAPAARLREAAAGLSKFFDGGRANCLVNLFSVGEANEAAPGVARSMAGALQDAFQAVARDAGASAKEAKQRAEQAIVEIEGALIVSRAQGSTGPFKRALERLPGIVAGDK